MVVGSRTTCAISAYYKYSSEFEQRWMKLEYPKKITELPQVTDNCIT